MVDDDHDHDNDNEDAVDGILNSLGLSPEQNVHRSRFHDRRRCKAIPLPSFASTDHPQEFLWVIEGI